MKVVETKEFLKGTEQEEFGASCGIADRVVRCCKENKTTILLTANRIQWILMSPRSV
jgi:hypothetical protein